MNVRNARALGLAFSKMLDAWFKLPENEVAQYDGPNMTFVGEFLAKEGVLVPSALTEDECIDLSDGWHNPDLEAESHAEANFRTALEHVARGG